MDFFHAHVCIPFFISYFRLGRKAFRNWRKTDINRNRQYSVACLSLCLSVCLSECLSVCAVVPISHNPQWNPAVKAPIPNSRDVCIFWAPAILTYPCRWWVHYSPAAVCRCAASRWHRSLNPLSYNWNSPFRPNWQFELAAIYARTHTNWHWVGSRCAAPQTDSRPGKSAKGARVFRWIRGKTRKIRRNTVELL